MDIAPFAARRTRLLERMAAQGGGIAVIPTAAEQLRNRDSHYPYRPDSYFHYLTGFDEPEAVLLLSTGDGEKKPPQSILFCRAKDADKEVWNGFRWGPEAARDTFGFDAAFPAETFDTKLAELLADQPALWFSLGHDAGWDARITAALNAVRAEVRTGKQAPGQINDVHRLLDDMRLIKDDSEIAVMRRAATISAAAP